MTTVTNNIFAVKNHIRMSNKVGLEGNFVTSSSMPSFDHADYKAVISIAMVSLGKGKNDERHAQFGTIREIRTRHSNIHFSLLLSAQNILSIKSAEDKS